MILEVSDTGCCVLRAECGCVCVCCLFLLSFACSLQYFLPLWEILQTDPGSCCCCCCSGSRWIPGTPHHHNHHQCRRCFTTSSDLSPPSRQQRKDSARCEIRWTVKREWWETLRRNQKEKWTWKCARARPPISNCHLHQWGPSGILCYSFLTDLMSCKSVCVSMCVSRRNWEKSMLQKQGNRKCNRSRWKWLSCARTTKDCSVPSFTGSVSHLKANLPNSPDAGPESESESGLQVRLQSSWETTDCAWRCCFLLDQTNLCNAHEEFMHSSTKAAWQTVTLEPAGKYHPPLLSWLVCNWEELQQHPDDTLRWTLGKPPKIKPHTLQGKKDSHFHT